MSLSFSELRNELREAPLTWLPALLKTIIFQCVIKKPYKDDHLLPVIQGIIKDGTDVANGRAQEEIHVE
jgi:hypothetical protein